MVVIEVTLAKHLLRLPSDQRVIEHGQRLRRVYTDQLMSLDHENYPAYSLFT